MADRIQLLNNASWRSEGHYVLYWAQMNRRVRSNHALAHAVELANRECLPVLFYEGLTCSYPYANDRFHTFVLEGVPDHRDMVLSESERTANKRMMVCCSGAKSPKLVLDL